MTCLLVSQGAHYNWLGSRYTLASLLQPERRFSGVVQLEQHDANAADMTDLRKSSKTAELSRTCGPRNTSGHVNFYPRIVNRSLRRGPLVPEGPSRWDVQSDTGLCVSSRPMVNSSRCFILSATYDLKLKMPFRVSPCHIENYQYPFQTVSYLAFSFLGTGDNSGEMSSNLRQANNKLWHITKKIQL